MNIMKELEIKSVVKVCQGEELNAGEQYVLEQAIEATTRAYAPYSHFRVGAAVRLANGVVMTGSNQENAAYPSGLCAERTVLFAAGSQYPDEAVELLAIAARTPDGELQEEPVSPCGACRQVIIETETRFKHPVRILLYGKKCVYTVDGISQLMPLAFEDF